MKGGFCMKHIKRLLSTLLALLLACGIGVPAMAEAEDELEVLIIIENEQQEQEAESPAEIETLSVNDDVPYIITPPQWQTITRGDSFTLSVEVYLPQGWIAAYQWQGYNGSVYVDLPGATESILQLSSRDSEYPDAGRPWWNGGRSYRCMITLQDEDGTVSNLISKHADVDVEPTRFWKAFGFIGSIAETIFIYLFAPIWFPFAMILIILIHLV